MTRADTIEREAARWVAQKDAGPLTEEQQRALDAWCAADSRHLGALVRLEAVNARLERLQALQGISAVKVPVRRWLPYATAASLLLALGLVWQGGFLSGEPTQARTLATRLGEQYRAQLVDGSTVELNTATRATVEVRAREREVKLTSGEALFEVAKDPDRPFIVRTALGDVRAVGTMFSVRVDNGLDVTVSEGVVSIERDGKEVARVSAGESFEMNPSGDARQRERDADEIQRAFAWREGKVSFAGETLAEAAATFNRYNAIKIQVEGAKAREMRFGGYYRTTDPEGFAQALKETLPVDVKREDETLIVHARD
ncbi:FecR family protein [Sphingosinicella rhizophila]|uniref:FecR domain-containing protein n=1 Tax=Sphingosinicella rhizophila TaxID=3050082 RepID=A0ABU3Q5J7_9SPHN|nr:FecR domain-containing protein [Sphingosinicella sp. GR2756]MDT9598688.1 FecR domain-containing protein [Sphingosinicella sp. GR2756]